ncbi:helix-turn-helix transcriptional regulator [Methylobacterium oxalidis]|uniref:helix-turn-helix transcriptional regulator n=1 Tax=Methylobacterium oxalidis TaxID=944322 RepID=UPI0011BD56BA|nr:helix-turn-helix transcriptional regulator [Methylobacterium oxalidis]
MVPQDERRATDCLASESLAEANAAYASVWWELDPWNLRSRSLTIRPGAVVRDSDLISPEDRLSLPFFQDFCRPHRMGDFAACFFVDPHDGRSYTISAFKDDRAGLHTAEDIERLRAMTPHVARAFTLSGVLSDARDHAAGLAAGLEGLRFGTIVLDASGRARDINSNAHGFLGTYLRLDGDRRLHALSSRDRSRFARLLASALPGGIGPGDTGMLLRPLADGRPLLVEAVPLRFVDVALSLVGSRRGGALILLHDIFAPIRPDIVELLVQLGLSAAEARLAQLVGRGLSPRAAASSLQIAESTVRVHLRSCFAKLGIARQSELAILVTRLDSLAGLPRIR